jgi:hypothetical protein
MCAAKDYSLWLVQVRLQKPLFDAVEGWRRQQETIPSRPEAIRRLLSKSLVENGGVPIQSAATGTDERYADVA